ncbi:MAG: hypothetical protein OJF60_001938 [Burkholderiaceae bacterium]|nr:MAG: hypothetical protein OJF60_001938 [Burkholderiaceae bacterium]
MVSCQHRKAAPGRHREHPVRGFVRKTNGVSGFGNRRQARSRG